MDKEKKKKFVTCPECGNVLFRSTDSDIEVRCPRCKADLIANISGTSVRVSHRQMMVAEDSPTYG